MSRRIFKFTRPRYGATWHSIAYRRGWMPVLQSGHVYDPCKRSIKSILRDNQYRLRRYTKRRQTLLDDLRLRMSFRSYSVRHPKARKR